MSPTLTEPVSTLAAPPAPVFPHSAHRYVDCGRNRGSLGLCAYCDNPAEWDTPIHNSRYGASGNGVATPEMGGEKWYWRALCSKHLIRKQRRRRNG